MITTDQLHEAADIVSTLEGYPEDAGIDAFIDESDFPNYPQLDEVSLAFGICIGIVVMTLPGVNNKEVVT